MESDYSREVREIEEFYIQFKAFFNIYFDKRRVRFIINELYNIYHTLCIQYNNWKKKANMSYHREMDRIIMNIQSNICV